MPTAKVAAFALLAALVGVGGWVTYRTGWLGRNARTGSSPRPPTLPDVAVEQPVAEYREVQSGPAGETGSLLTINRAGQAIVQTIPLGPGSKTMHAELTCAELGELPQAMNAEFPKFLPSYGREGPPYQGELSMVNRWKSPERRVVWHNPLSPATPPGSWSGVAVYFEDIRRRARS